MQEISEGFSELTPDLILAAVEEATGKGTTGLLTPFHSYINRVYEVETDDGDRLIAKFYRPGRWSRAALEEEHRFVLDCTELEIPVVPPLPLKNSRTLDTFQGYNFALFPKKAGRLFELNCDEDYIRAGALIGRIHAAGEKRQASHRIRLTPADSTARDIEELLQAGVIHPGYQQDFRDITDEILTLITPLFEGIPLQRIHGDCHQGNILVRPERDGSGTLMIIDFDDMATGPAVQDLWLLLPGHASESVREMNLLIEGYEQFYPFDIFSRKLIEPLRAMRIVYFLAWCARQSGDYRFRHDFPDWGSDKFWENEIDDLRKQLAEIRDSLQGTG